MSTNRSVGRSTATQEKDRFASKSKKDRSTNLCAFTFADGRQCRTPRCSGHLHLCYFHAQKEAQSLAAKQAGKDISTFFFANLLTACDLSAAMARLFTAVAQGQIKPKVAGTLAYLSQTMLQSIPIAQHEYCEAFGTEPWRRAVRSSFTPSAPAPQPAPQPPASAPPSPTPVEAGLKPGSSASSSSTSPTAPQPSAQQAPSPHTPFPSTSAEFDQQVLAGRNSSRSETPTQSRPGREPGSSESSSSPAPSSASPVAPQSSVNCHSERSEEPAAASPSFKSPLPQASQPAPSSPSTPPTPNNSQPAPPPPARQPTSPQQSQPTQYSQHNSLPAPAPHAPRLYHPVLAPPPTGTS